MTKLLILYLSILSASSTIFQNTLPQTRNNAKASYMAKLLKKSQPTGKSANRRLEDAEVDISGYEVKFEKCQFVKVYSDDLAMNEDYDTVLSLQKFVIFRLCPSGTCQNCVYDYGEYVIDMSSYLEATVGYFEDWQENMCDQCDEVCANDDGDDGGDDANGRKLDVNVNCDYCVNYCEKINEMEDNNFLEASNFIECQQIYESDDGGVLYAGGMCSSSGEKIKIGVFTDEYCSILQQDLDVEDYLGGYKLSHALMKQIYEKDTCISCTELNWEVPDDDNNKNEDDDVELTEMCQELYEEAGKCESIYGFNNYWKENEDYMNQYAQEDQVCDFISSLMNGNYDQEGEIYLTVCAPNYAYSLSLFEIYYTNFFIL